MSMPKPRRGVRAAALVAAAGAALGAFAAGPVANASGDTPIRGVTADTIKLGVATIDFEAVRDQYGVDLGNLPEGTYQAFADAVNANGGINGRQVEIVEKTFIPVGTESSLAVCRELIEDEEVYAVLGLFLGDAGLCVTETYATPYFGAFGLNDERQERSLAPFLSLEGYFLNAAVQGIVDNGVLDGRKIAVYSESDVSPAQLEADVIAPLNEAGLEVVSSAQLPSTGDLVQAASDIDLIFQRFQADGADAVLAVSGAPVFLPALERTDWKPQLVFTNGQFTGDSGLEGFGLTDFNELDGAKAITTTLRTTDLLEDPMMIDCIDWINEYAGGDYAPTDLFPVDKEPESKAIGPVPQACQTWTMMMAVLEGVGENLDADSFTAALDDVGTFPVAGYGEAEITSTRWGAVDSIRVWDFDLAEEAFVPVTDWA